MFRALRKALVVVPLLWQGSGAVVSSAGENVAGWVRDARALEAELHLASKEGIYLILDGRDATVRVKAAGLTLKTLPITRWTFWGSPVAPAPRMLLRRSALIEPMRPRITPEAADQPIDDAGGLVSPRAGTDLEVLELKDMPARFRLALDQGVRITVRPEPEGFFSRWWERAHYAGWYLTRPLPTVWNSMLGRPYSALYLRIAAQDARALYWACRDGTEFLVISP
ncbi:MAG TPA: hypothetical protein VLT62_30285 [Candidatus Methylomirabilis sp.]|nr:hypothetical protein [Candidatus Methylomirabilis sp.]